MKPKHRLRSSLLSLVCLIPMIGLAHPQTQLSKPQLLEDYAVLRKALEQLHPGLYRYADRAVIDGHFDDLLTQLNQPMSLAEAYLVFSRFLAKIQCGHTYANFWNQSDQVKSELFDRADKLPFTFRLISGQTVSASVRPVTRLRRKELIEERHGPQPTSYDDLWSFSRLDEQTGYLKLGTFVTWKMQMDWQRFIDDAFTSLRENHIPYLILDIRGNEGGADAVMEALGRFLISKPALYPARRQLLRYVQTPPDLDPYLDTWDEGFKDRRGEVKETGDGFFTWKGASHEPLRLEPGPDAYQGQILLLVDAANSSATFNLARVLKENGLATLIGEETGGNRRGITGSQMFFLRLPNSKIEVDIPLVAGFPLTPQPDGGIQPDLPVPVRVEDFLNGVDTVLEAARGHIKRLKAGRE